MGDDLTPLGGIGSTPSPPSADGLVPVRLPSGAAFPVHPQEVDYLTALGERYMEEHHFSNVSDLQDLDRLLLMELMCFRWGTWLSRGVDYDHNTVDVDELQKAIRTHSGEVRQIKKAMEIDTVSRSKAKGEDSVAGFINNLLARAKEFGVMREAQLAQALNLIQDIKAWVTLYENCDPEERRELHVELEDLVGWLKTVVFPEFDTVDDYFRAHHQRMWVRSL